MSISASVGKSGINKPMDVLLIQKALNQVRIASKQQSIREDGRIGLETIGAIIDFQQRFTSMRDGRIDPNGPTIRLLGDKVRDKSEPRIRAAVQSILNELDAQLNARGLQLPPRVLASVSEVAAAAGVKYGSNSGRPRVQFAAAVAAPAAAAAMQAALMALVAMVGLMIVIHSLPVMGRGMEELLRKVQGAMSIIAEGVKSGLESIEEMIRNNMAAAARCSALIIAFRELSQQILDQLDAPRPTDELGRKRWSKQLGDLKSKWDDAFAAVMACMMSGI